MSNKTKTELNNMSRYKRPTYTPDELKASAISHGYKLVPSKKCKGQPIYKKGRSYITPDIGSGDGKGAHNGGAWKMATSIKNLHSKATRLGTYDIDLKRIGD